MTDSAGQGQADKKAAEERTAQVGRENRAQDEQSGKGSRAQDDQPRSAAAKVLKVDPSEAAGDPFPAYDLMTLDQLRELAKVRKVEMNRDVEKANLISEFRAADTHTG